ncbi:MAG: DUF1905 domain-containing protein [Cytophagales bacterium]|nr:DUF1905 domain-containing protein [Cytophagales bacterium]
MQITVESFLSHFHNNLWKHYIPIPKDIGDKFIEGDNRRVLCSVNDSENYQLALMPRVDDYVLLINEQRRKKLGIEEGDEVTVTLEKDTSEFGHEVPESFDALLAQDDEGRSYFEALTIGKQRGLIYIVGKVKNVDSQIAKGLAIMHHLKEAKGVLDYKRLNVLIKEYNSKR